MPAMRPGQSVMADTDANWIAVNPIIPKGIIAVSTDTETLKIGDGTTAWRSLGEMSSANASALNEDINVYVDVAATGNGTGINWDNAFTTIQAAIDSLPLVINATAYVLVKHGTYDEELTIKRLGLGRIEFCPDYANCTFTCGAQSTPGKAVATGIENNAALGDYIICMYENAAPNASFCLPVTDKGTSYLLASGTTDIPTTGWICSVASINVNHAVLINGTCLVIFHGFHFLDNVTIYGTPYASVLITDSYIEGELYSEESSISLLYTYIDDYTECISAEYLQFYSVIFKADMSLENCYARLTSINLSGTLYAMVCDGYAQQVIFGGSPGIELDSANTNIGLIDSSFTGSGIYAYYDELMQVENLTDTTKQAQPNYEYLISATSDVTTITLPQNRYIGNKIKVTGYGSNGWAIQSSVGDTITRDGTTTAANGAITSSNRYDSVTLEYIASGEWLVLESSNASTLNGATNGDFATDDHDHDLTYLGIDDKADDSAALNGATNGDFAAANHTHDVAYPTIATDTSAPTSTPSKVGDIFVNTSAKDVYLAAGTGSSSDWIKLN